MCGGLNGVGGIIGDDGLEVGSLATFLSPVAIGSICSDVGHLLPFVEDGFCDINAVHCVVSQVGWEWRDCRSRCGGSGGSGVTGTNDRSEGVKERIECSAGVGGLSRSRKRRRRIRNIAESAREREEKTAMQSLG